MTAFDPPAERWLAGHRGVDLAAAPLTTVHAPADGTVVFAGAVGGRPVLSIDHGAGLRTTYEPVRATVRTGDSVTTGEAVAHLLAGHAGCPVDSCLHWGAR
ncbi:MAG: M23 family metallopeptidase, partial [Dietzia sp.]